jgi:hypothetical protein
MVSTSLPFSYSLPSLHQLSCIKVSPLEKVKSFLICLSLIRGWDLNVKYFDSSSQEKSKVCVAILISFWSQKLSSKLFPGGGLL